MKVRTVVGPFVLATLMLLSARLSQAGVFITDDGAQVSTYDNGSWAAGYYDTAYGMPLAVLVPPTARWQTNYSWGVGGTRISRVGATFESQYPGPASYYNRGYYLPAPPQPTDTMQMGDYYVRGPRR
jgi:hypothetical protein